jgi:isoamylase
LFAPEARYFTNGEIGEFKTMVKALHVAGIEVILDVVYNHTAEGNELGPTLSFRGIDNSSYYRLDPNNKRHYVDFTGCKNSFNLHHPSVVHLVMDSLRYWVQEMHVDGFRFDLATATAREQDGHFDRFSGFLDAVRQDPVLSPVKLIAEPWDIGPGGYQLGNFPPGWAEWNDRYRDTVRCFWKGDDGVVDELARRITGSSDIFDKNGRRSWASINFVTAHDGFTLHDLVSYNDKHNEANNEENRDGTDQNHSWNCGVEGPTRDPAIRERRMQQRRNILATLLLSEGTPMLLAGDELGHTQKGNNNAYCQDNEVSWIRWQHLGTGAKLHDFVRKLIKLRREHVVFRRGRFFHGTPTPGTATKDITWLRPDGQEKRPVDWNVSRAHSLSFVLSGEAGQYHLTAAGEGESGDTFLVIMNAEHETIDHRMPRFDSTAAWELVFDTSVGDGLDGSGRRYEPGDIYAAAPRSFVLLVRRASEVPSE